MKHLLKLLDLSREEIIGILNLADQLKYELKHGIEHKLLAGKTLGMIFQKSSTRTRVSFETGIYQLGGQGLFLSSRDLQIGRGEPVEDTARVLSRYLDGIMIRTFEQKEVEDLAKFGSIPVINDLSRVKAAVKDLAKGLIQLYAQRQRQPGAERDPGGDRDLPQQRAERRVLPGQLAHQPGAFPPVHLRDPAQSRGHRSARVEGHHARSSSRVRRCVGLRVVRLRAVGSGRFCRPGPRPRRGSRVRSRVLVAGTRSSRGGGRRAGSAPARTGSANRAVRTLREQYKSITSAAPDQGVIRGRSRCGKGTEQ